MDIMPTDFIKKTADVAEYFGFKRVDELQRHPNCRACTRKLRHSAPATERKLDALHGLLTSGVSLFCDARLHSIGEPVLFYNLEKVPRSGDVAVSLHIFGVPKSIAESILIHTTGVLLQDLGYPHFGIRINSLGDRDSSARYLRELTTYLRKRLDDMPPTARELMKDNTLAALLHLIEKNHDLAYKSPNPLEYLSDQSRKHFRDIIEYLDMSETPYEIDPKLVGHHHCYSDALFAVDLKDEHGELLPEAPLFIRGGRYSEFTTRHTEEPQSAAGAVIMLRNKKAPQRIPRASKTLTPSVYVVQLGFGPKVRSLLLVDTLRRHAIPTYQNLACDSLSTQLRDAEARGVRHTIIIGQKEYVENTVILRDMEARTQEYIPVADVPRYLKKLAPVATVS